MGELAIEWTLGVELTGRNTVTIIPEFNQPACPTYAFTQAKN